MWHTSQGDRTLTGPEAVLLKTAAMSLAGEILDDEQAEINVPVGSAPFDRLNHPQKIAMLCNVAQALLVPERPAPELAALNEATVHAVYLSLLSEIEFELDDKSTRLRRLVLEVARPEDGSDEERPAPSCRDMEEWQMLVELCEDRILWDRDFQLEDEILDAPPEISKGQKQFLCIEDDYFRAVAPDPSPFEHRANIRRLLGLLSLPAADRPLA